jgi:Kef-type K+ transport system membrane component KefB
LIFFLFLIGMELDIETLSKKAHSAIVISHVSILFPFFLGMLLALGLYPGFVPPGVGFLPFSLFMGIALSITAFPVLARILQERDLASTRMGAMVLACAAADDVTAWSILAAVVAVGRAADPIQGLTVISLTLLFILLMFRFARPVLSRLGRAYESRESLTPAALGGIFFFIFGSALMTETIGVHALFGAFLAGTVLPRNARLREQISEKIRDLSLIVLLPLFFAFTGIRTQIGLLDEPVEWMIGAGIFTAAVLGKFGGGVVASRIVGESWKDSFSIGALMNARGLMELVVLNIGYDLGIISPEIFAMMVLMALGTTFMTGPALDLIERFSKKRLSRTERRGIVVAFARPETGLTLMRIAMLLRGTSRITAVHFDPEARLPGEQTPSVVQAMERLRELEREGGVRLLFRSAEDVAAGIVRRTQEEGAGFLLLGSARSVWSDDVLGGKVRFVLNRVSCPVGVLSDRGLKEIQKVLIVRRSQDDDRLLALWRSVAGLPGVRCDLLTLEESYRPEERRRNRGEPFFAVARSAITPAALEEYSLVTLDRSLWGEIGSIGMNISCLVVSFPD